MIKKARKILNDYFGYDSFKEGQERTISSILNGKDTFTIMPTGGGKSLCYQIPALILEGTGLVISPLISLMKDQVDSLNSVGISASFINSSLSRKELENRIYRAKNGEFKLLYLAPERLKSPVFLRLLKGLNISMLAVDEAHCVSHWGHDFRPSYRLIASMIEKLPNRPIMTAFTATATEEVKNDVVKLLKLRDPDIFITGFDRENLFLSVLKGENEKDFILEYLKNKRDESGIIYAGTRKNVDSICKLLQDKGYKAGRYHAGLSTAERKKTQNDFTYDEIEIIVATNAFGMGIDKSNIRYVIHYNMPQSIEAYYQEAGRAGRDGEASDCILLYGPGDVQLHKFLIEENSSSTDLKKMRYEKLQAMEDYCHTTGCLRKFILEYFGERNIPELCNNCSNCNLNHEIKDITIEAQKIFSCIYRMKERYGVSLVSQVLKGSKRKKVRQLGLEKLSTYGIMQGYTLKEIKDMCKSLIAEAYLYLSGGKYPVVKLGERAISVLKDEKKVFQKVWKAKEEPVEDNELFELLKARRKEIATKENLPPYIIFHDSTLQEMSKYIPEDKEAMMNIKGMGEIKFDKYGLQFLELIQEYLAKNREKAPEY